ncbi:F-box/LRR-repeat protein 12-like [Papaver somniferum]|uniref:F-box/LRR-repeat protein 12-like n=1 Tax=Papaver somniferum TaxID=3469 RepID=UPI000E704246|nr:F-box/LRR-repeat protein 12-like [Papaver somniferum]
MALIVVDSQGEELSVYFPYLYGYSDHLHRKHAREEGGQGERRSKNQLPLFSLSEAPTVTAPSTFDISSYHTQANLQKNKNCRSIEYTSLTNYEKTKSLTVVLDVSLKGCDITDEGLKALAKCCSSLEVVNLSWCDLITDSGISFRLRNYRELDSLNIGFRSKITGIGFLGCPQTLTWLEENGSKLTPEGIKAIVRGGGLEYLELSARTKLSWVGEESGTMTMNTEAVLMILKGCPSLRELKVSGFVEVIKPEGWEAILRNCKRLKVLQVYACCSFGDRERKALMDGCKKFSILIANDDNSCGSSDDHEPF